MKKKLFASVISLVIAAVMMTSASFAWFTVSSTANMGTINTTLGATYNIEIVIKE